MRYLSILLLSSTCHQSSLFLNLLLHASSHSLSSSPHDTRVSVAAVPHLRPRSPLQPHHRHLQLLHPMAPEELGGRIGAARTVREGLHRRGLNFLDNAASRAPLDLPSTPSCKPSTPPSLPCCLLHRTAPINAPVVGPGQRQRPRQQATAPPTRAAGLPTPSSLSRRGCVGGAEGARLRLPRREWDAAALGGERGGGVVKGRGVRRSARRGEREGDHQDRELMQGHFRLSPLFSWF